MQEEISEETPEKDLEEAKRWNNFNYEKCDYRAYYPNYNI